MGHVYINMGTVKPTQIAYGTADIRIPIDTNITARLQYNPTGWFSITHVSSYKVREIPMDCDPYELDPKELKKCREARSRGQKIEEKELVGTSDGSTPLFVTKDLLVEVGISSCVPFKNFTRRPNETNVRSCELIVDGDTWKNPEEYVPIVAIDCPINGHGGY